MVRRHLLGDEQATAEVKTVAQPVRTAEERREQVDPT
jgi:hypothetical protein